MSFKQFLLPLIIILIVALSFLLATTDWYKNLIKKEQISIQQSTSREKINEQKRGQNKTLIFLEKPNKIHLIEVDDNGQKISTERFDISAEINEVRQIVGNRLYFFDKEGLIRYVDLKNKQVNKINFVIKDWGHWPYGGKNFLISPDNKKLFWTVTKYKNLTEKEKQKLEKGETLWPADIKYPERWYVEMWMADLENQNIKLLFQKDLTVGEYILPLKFSSFQKEIYFLETITGLGGYTPFRCPPGILYKVNLEDGKINKLVGEDEKEYYIGFCNFSSDGKLIVYSLSHNLIIKNLVTKEKVVIPVDKKFAYFGNAFFSPDNKFLVYSSAFGDPDNEKYTITLVNLSTLEKKEVLNGLYFLRGWLDEKNLVVQNLDGNVYLINKDHVGLRKISNFDFIGIIE